jgi:acetoin utilization protein AcuB
VLGKKPARALLDEGPVMAGTPARLEEAFAMLVHDIMQPRVITAPPQTDVAEALAILRTRGVRHLVILDGDALVGIVSDRDVKQAGALDERLGRWTVGDIMSRSVITIEPSAPVEDAAQLMLTNTISALPVTDAGRLVGIVTETDVVRLFVKALGAGEPSSRIDVVIPPNVGALPDIVATAQAGGAPVSSVVTLPGSGGVKDAVIRIGTIDPRPAIAALTARGYTVKTAWRGGALAERVA